MFPQDDHETQHVIELFPNLFSGRLFWEGARLHKYQIQRHHDMCPLLPLLLLCGALHKPRALLQFYSAPTTRCTLLHILTSLESKHDLS